MLSKEAIKEFKTIYRQVYGEELSDANALTKANKLFDLYRVIFGHLTKGSERDKNNYEQRNTDK